MKLTDFHVLICDYDRTLTDEALNLSQEAIETIRDAKEKKQLVFILVSGRGLDFLNSMKMHIADAIVAENGALIYLPSKKKKVLLGKEVGERIKIIFDRAEFPIEFSEVMASTNRVYEEKVIAMIESAGLDVNIEYNKESLMILPQGVNKGSGAIKALELLKESKKGIICFGDGENDIPLFDIADFSVAVGNAVTPLKKRADFVCEKAGGACVADFIREKILKQINNG